MSEKKRRQDGSPKSQSFEVHKVKCRSIPPKELYGPELSFNEAQNIFEIEVEHRTEEEKRKLYAYQTRGGENDQIVTKYADGNIYTEKTGINDPNEYLTTPGGLVTNETRDAVKKDPTYIPDLDEDE